MSDPVKQKILAWFYGLVWSFVYGGVTAVGSMGGLDIASNHLGQFGIAVDSLTFNQVLGIFLSAAVTRGVSYIKKHRPPVDMPFDDSGTDIIVRRPTNKPE